MEPNPFHPVYTACIQGFFCMLYVSLAMNYPVPINKKELSLINFLCGTSTIKYDLLSRVGLSYLLGQIILFSGIRQGWLSRYRKKNTDMNL